MRTNATYWKCQIAGWSLYTVSSFGISVAFGQRMTGQLIAGTVFGNGVGFVVTHLWRTWIRRRRWAELAFVPLLLRVIPTCLLLALVWEIVAGTAMFARYGVFIPREIRAGVAFVTWFNWSATLFIWSLIYFGVHFFERYKQAEILRWRTEAVAKDAELRALKSQLNPHFLFNALNSIRALIVEDPERGQAAVTKLAEMLRYALQSSATETVTLQAEMRFVEAYLALESIRFEERLTVRLDISPETLDRAVPPMIVQTLVENAVKHGIARRRDGGAIDVSSHLDSSILTVRVRNDGHLSSASPEDSQRLGLRNVEERLRLLFGVASSIQLSENGGESVTAELNLPARAVNGDLRDHARTDR